MSGSVTEPGGLPAAPEPVVAAPEPIAAPAAPAPEPAVVEAAPPPAAPSAPAAHTDTPTLLEGAGAEAKPGDPAKPPEAAATDPAAAEPGKPTPIDYGEFKFPEGFKPDAEQLTAAKSIFNELGVPPDKAQSLVDLYATNAAAYATGLAAEQHRVFAQTRADWRTQVMADEELGGAGYQTSLAAIARARDLLVPKDRINAFNDMLRVTGVGDHPEFLRLLHRAARRFDEPGNPPQAAKPPPGIGKPPGRQGLRSIYTHPSSQNDG